MKLLIFKKNETRWNLLKELLHGTCKCGMTKFNEQWTHKIQEQTKDKNKNNLLSTYNIVKGNIHDYISKNQSYFKTCSVY